MPRFEGKHQPFKAAKPYWLKPPKTEAQQKHFARMAAAVKARTPGYVVIANPIAMPDIVVDPIMLDLNHEDDHQRPETPDFIEDIRRARLEDERQQRALALIRATQEMFYAYLECYRSTAEWGDPTKWDVDHKSACGCAPSTWRTRNVDMVDLLYRRKVEVRFCGCQENDNTRLIYMGYIGGSPKYPETVFSIRLLRFFHIIWKYCTSRVDPWTRALDEFLDAFNPLILTKNEQPRRWQTPFRWAIDAYRKMLSATKSAIDMEMSLSPADKLAENCPRCFGPPVASVIDGEPDIVVCLDGNFQHRRHMVAGQRAAKIPTIMPESFLAKEQVSRMEAHLEGAPEDDAEPCAAQHTAANDRRGKGHWAGCDETGLMVLVCRHDHPLRFANIVQSGEKLHYPYWLIEWFLGMTDDQKIGFLYDIGCQMEKGIEKRDMFNEEQHSGRLKFGTSVFHAYVHRWACQLEWNPRLNLGWGLSDGEGSERVWSDLDPLVSSERYTTKQHRVDSIHMRSTHCRTNLRQTAVVHLSRKRSEAIQQLNEAEEALRSLAIADPTLTPDHFEAKWTEQKARQLDVINETQKQKRERLKVLLGLEEELVEALKRLTGIQSLRRRVRTQAENIELMALPGSVASIEEQIEEMADELGGTEFRDLAGATRDQHTALLALSVAQAKLYEARVGLTEARLRRHRNTGAQQQQYMAQHLGDRTRDVRTKYNSYCRRVERYGVDFSDALQPEKPDLETIMSMPLDDPFWNRGEVPPKEREGAERDRLGIQSFLSRRSSQEELRRIAREVRQMTGWANSYHGRIKSLKQRVAAAPVGSIRDRLTCLYSIVSKKACKLWKKWGVELKRQLQETSTLLVNTREMDKILKKGFEKVTKWTEKLWRKMAGIQAQEPSEFEEAEDEEYDQLYDMFGELII